MTGKLIIPKSIFITCGDPVRFIYNNISKHIRVRFMEEDYSSNSCIFHYHTNSKIKDRLIVVLSKDSIYYSEKGENK